MIPSSFALSVFAFNHTFRVFQLCFRFANAIFSEYWFEKSPFTVFFAVKLFDDGFNFRVNVFLSAFVLSEAGLEHVLGFDFMLKARLAQMLFGC